jgi:hypothetical protein
MGLTPSLIVNKAVGADARAHCASPTTASAIIKALACLFIGVSIHAPLGKHNFSLRSTRSTDPQNPSVEIHSRQYSDITYYYTVWLC